jgi:hypothetical protein
MLAAAVLGRSHRSGNARRVTSTLRRGSSIVAAVIAVLAAVPSAGAQPGMFVGVREDGLKWRTASTAAVARDLGLGAVGITLGWQAGTTELTSFDRLLLDGTVAGAGGMRIVVAVFGDSSFTPVDAQAREQYCAYVGSLVARYPQINDVVIWNEPNLNWFWQPQYREGVSEAPARYTELLARCYDVLHGIRGSVNVIGPATSLWGNDNPNAIENVSHSPTSFIREMGSAYRKSGRTRPLFDTLGHHPYPARSDERPWAPHADEMIISIGDLGRLVRTLHEAFDGTAQSTPENGLPIWYLETGYQTQIDSDKAPLYGGVETWPGALPDRVANPGPPVEPPDLSPAPDQATQLVDSLRLTYCEPYVTGVFNFLLRDETNLSGWQSGLLWADGSRKDSYDVFRTAVQEVNEGRVDCAKVAAALALVSGTSARGGTASGTAPAAARSVTKVSFRGGTRMPYGYLKLAVRLTRGVNASTDGLSAKQLLFVVGGTAYVVPTDGSGVARMTPMPPMNPGRHKIRITFRGDTLNLASGLRLTVQVANSRGSMRSVGAVRLGSVLSGRLTARSNGSKVSGTLSFRQGGKVRAVRLTALGIRSDARAGWIRGASGPDRYVLNVERLRAKPLLRVRMWRNGTPVGGAATIPASKLRILPA